ncbi:hypothetical protein [Deinococcus sp.]|uniref:hypothetical protein n=1 Tax=Deinococcus sp. TaxID=47478 RepID=UPI003CC627E6
MCACAPRLASAGVSHLRASAVTPTTTLNFGCDPVQPGGSPVYVTPDTSFSCASTDGKATLTLLLIPTSTSTQRSSGAPSNPAGYFVLTTSAAPASSYRGAVTFSRFSSYSLPGGSEVSATFRAVEGGNVVLDGDFTLKS